ncbi:MAG: hypothetical protein ABIG28_00120 [archaeon]
MVRGTDITDRKLIYRNRDEGDFPERLVIELTKEWDLRYGENPGQHGMICTLDTVNGIDVGTVPRLTNLQSVRTDGKGKGGLSLTNTMDITRAMDDLKFFPGVLAVAIKKHNVVSGFAMAVDDSQTQRDIFRLARDSDLRSNFGGTAVFNAPLGMEAAEAMFELGGVSPFFVDVVAAPGYEAGVVGYIQGRKKDIRIGEFASLDRLPRFVGDETYGLVSIKEMPTGRIGIQDVYLTGIRKVEDLVLDPSVRDGNTAKEFVVEKDPTSRELRDLLTAWHLNITGARSNGIVVVRDGVTIAVGSGQVERVGAVEQAIVKGMQKAMDRQGIEYDPLMGMSGYEQLAENPFEGAVCSSDAFFPFRDSIDTLARVGVTAVVQPYGSNRDWESVQAANEHNMAMPASDKRCFGHF